MENSGDNEDKEGSLKNLTAVKAKRKAGNGTAFSRIRTRSDVTQMFVNTKKPSGSDVSQEDEADSVQKPGAAPVRIADVTWESAPSYDGEQPGDYVFSAVLPGGYDMAAGVELPQIRVTVAEETLEEEASAAVYASMPVNEVASLTKREGTRETAIVSSDDAGDRHKVRLLWQTIGTVSKNAPTTGCEKSWVAFRVPGMDEELKFNFTKDMLLNPSEAYRLAEFTLPYTYEDGGDIFPDKLGIYSALSSLSGQFMGRVTLQAYDYLSKEWKSYVYYEISPQMSLTGSALTEAVWVSLDQPVTCIDYVDIDQGDLYMEGSDRVEKSWDLVCMDNFGVVVTEKSKGWSDNWELQLKNGSAYPDRYQIGLEGSLEGFKLTAASGVNGIPREDRPWVCAVIRGNGEATSTLKIGIGIIERRVFLQYCDAKGVVYSETVAEGDSCQVADVTKAALNQGRDIALKEGHGFAGAYTGSDGKTYRPGETIDSVEQSINFYMTWEPQTCRVTLDGQIDQKGERTLTENGKYEMELTYGQLGVEDAPIPPQAPDRYRFNGWVGEADGREVQFFDKEGKPFNKWRGDGDSVLTVRWALKNIYYYLNPGASDAWCTNAGFIFENPASEDRRPKLSEYGKKLPQTEDEVYRHGYELLGWYTTRSGEGERIDEDYPLPLEDTYFYARWKPVEVTLKLDAGDGSFDGGGQTCEIGEKVYYKQKFGEISDKLPVPVRLGYELAGWGYSERSQIRDVLDDSSALQETADFTLYAVWKKKELSVYLDAAGGSFASPEDARMKALPGDTITLPAPTRTGYTLTGWRDAAGNETNGSACQIPGNADASFTLTAVWQANTYQLEFNRNSSGAGGMAAQTLTYDSAFTLPENQFARTGYRFAGWNTKADGSGISYADRAAVKNLATKGSVTLYAQWTPVTFSVSFDPNGGTLTDSGDSGMPVTYDAAYGALPVPVRNRYNFKGWFTAREGGEQMTETSKVETAAAHTLYAQWEYAWFTLSFDLRGGSGSKDCAFGNMEGGKKEGIVLPTAIPERTGWEFQGWSVRQGTTADAGYTREDIQGGSAPKVLSGGKEKVTLYAVWYSDTPVLRYDANVVGTDGGVSGMPLDAQMNNGSVTVSTQRPSRTGYTFMGWALTPDGQALYKKEGENKTETINSAVSVILYAVWKADEAPGVGTFSSNYECKYLKGGKWHFTTLKTALAEVPAGSEIVLLKNIAGKDAAGNSEMALSVSKNFTLNLNKYKLDYDGTVSFSGSGGEITIKNGNVGSLFVVKSGAKVIVDSVRFPGDNTDGTDIRTEGSGTHLTLQGKTVVLDRTLRIGQGTTLHVKYAEIGVECKTKTKCVFEVDGGTLEIDDGYFYVGALKKDDSSSSATNLIVSKNDNPASVYKLRGGYFGGETYNAGDSTGRGLSYYSATSAEGRYVVCHPTVQYNGNKEKDLRGMPSIPWLRTWFYSPADAVLPSADCWEISDGGRSPRKVEEKEIGNDDYVSENTWFKLLKGVTLNKGLVLDKQDHRSVIDLNGNEIQVQVQEGVSLDSFVLKGGMLNASRGMVKSMTLKHGTVEADVQIMNWGEIVLDDVILKRGATIYIGKNWKADFEASYVTNEKDFGGTKLVQEGEMRYNCYPYRAVEQGTPRVTFHANYPGESLQEEQTIVLDQAIGSVYKIPAASGFAVPGYVFDYWNTKQDGTGERITSQIKYHDRDVTDLYAVWRRTYVTAVFDRNGGEWKDQAALGVTQDAAIAARNVPYSMALGALPTVSRDGYGFAGWYTEKTGGSQVYADTKVTKDQTYYARWTPADGTKYTVVWQGEVTGGEREFGREERFGRTDGTVQLSGLIQSFDGYAYSGYTVTHSGKPGGSSGTEADAAFSIRADGSLVVTIKYRLKYNEVAVTVKRQDVADVGAVSAETPVSGVKIILSGLGHVDQGGAAVTTGSMMTSAAGTASAYYKYGSGVTLTAPEIEGCRFAGWSGHYTAAENALTFSMSDRKVAVTALYKQNASAVEKSLGHIRVMTEGEKVAASGQDVRKAMPPEGVPYGYTYILTFTAEEGYGLPEQIALQRGTESGKILTDGENVTGNEVYSRSADGKTGILTVKNVKTPLYVAAAGEAKQYTVTFTGQHVTASPAGPVHAGHGSVFMMNLTAEDGYDLPDGLTVTMGGRELTLGTDCTYDTVDGSVCIGAVTGDVEISAAAVPAPASYQVEYYLQDVDGAYGAVPYDTQRFYDRKTQETVSLIKTDGALGTEYEKTYSGYTFDRDAAENVTTGTVDASGALTLKVCYKRNEYRVGIADGYFWADGTDEEKTYPYGFPVELAVEEKTGYDADWSGGGGLGGLGRQVSFYMPAKDVKITPSYRSQPLAATEAGLTNVRFTEGTETTAYYEQEYSAVIEPLTGYDLPAGIVVKVAGKPLASGDFTYDPVTGAVSIRAEKVTGSIEITASGERQRKHAEIAFENNEMPDGRKILTADKMAEEVASGEAFQVRLSVFAESGYALPEPEREPDSLTVTMGGRTLVCGRDYTYDSDSGLLRVPNVVEDVTVKASPTVKEQKADYRIEHYKEDMDGVYTLAQRVRKEGIVGTTVTAGTTVVQLKNYTGYAYDDSIPGTVASEEVRADGSTVLKLYYSRKACILTLSAETGITVEARAGAAGGASGGIETVQPEGRKEIIYKYGQSVTVRVSDTTEGNSFTGWYQAGESKGRAASYSLVMTEDLTLTAKSGEKRYELVVNGSHGKSSLEEDCEENISGGTEKTVELVADTGYHLPTAVVLIVDGEESQGYTYTKESENLAKVSLRVTGDTEIVFVAEANHYRLILDANGGRVKLNETDAAEAQVEREAVYDAAYGELPKAQRSGYTFRGWFTEKAGGEEITGESVHLTDGDRTVYAKWRMNPKKDSGESGSVDKEPELPPGEETSGTGPDMPPENPEKEEPETEDPAPEMKTIPSDLPEREKEPEDGSGEEEEKGSSLPEGEGIVTVPAVMQDGRLTPEDKKVWKAGEADIRTVVFTVMDSAVIVHMNNVEGTACVAAVTDAAAAANAVMRAEEYRRLTAGDVIEIRIDVTPYDDQVSGQDRQLIQAQAAKSANAPLTVEGEDGAQDPAGTEDGLTVGLYMDISVFMRINEEPWQEIHITGQPVGIVVQIPESLLEDSADGKFCILRVHDGECDLLEDMDEMPETVTFESGLFSVYAVAYTRKTADTDTGMTVGARAGRTSACGLCHICPALLGICYFIWLLLAVATAVAIRLFYMRKQKKKEEREKEDV